MSSVIAWSTALAGLVWVAACLAPREGARQLPTDVKRSQSWLQGWAKASQLLFAILGLGALLLEPDNLQLGLAAGPLQLLGLLISLAAAVLTLRARVELGHSFADDMRVWGGQVLATKGLFRLVRHPMYLGTILMWLGAGLGMLSWLLLVVGLVIMLPTHHLLARREEQLMVDRFGRVYQEYQARVPMLFPWPRA